MNRILTVATHVLITVVGFLGYVFLHAHWYRLVFAFIGIISGMRYFAQHKEWSKRTLFTIVTIMVFLALFVLLQLFGWIEYGQ